MLFGQVEAAGGANAPLWLDNVASFVAATAAREPGSLASILAASAGPLRGDLLLRIADGLWSSGHRGEARALNARVRAALRSDEAWVQQGRFELGDGRRDQAARAFAEALAIAPDRADARAFARRLAEPPPRPGEALPAR
jgi:hypothetical protein